MSERRERGDASSPAAVTPFKSVRLPPVECSQVGRRGERGWRWLAEWLKLSCYASTMGGGCCSSARLACRRGASLVEVVTFVLGCVFFLVRRRVVVRPV